MKHLPLTGIERFLDESELIISRTDIKGRITYANRALWDITGYSESELLGKPHSILRHPGMPRYIFKLLWETISSGHEIFAYIINRCKNGDHYWVLGHISPTFNEKGEITGYLSDRRYPKRPAINKIKPLYDLLIKTENSFSAPNQGMKESEKLLNSTLNQSRMEYERFIFSL